MGCRCRWSLLLPRLRTISVSEPTDRLDQRFRLLPEDGRAGICDTGAELT
jgi:hypothetical protein